MSATNIAGVNNLLTLSFYVSKKRGQGDTKTFLSFQSMGATNIAGVNNLLSLSFYVSKKRGQGDAKHIWGIEQNETKSTCINHYHAIDQADHMIKNTSIKYITWKYWHAPYLHAVSKGIVAAFVMYLDCAEGFLDAVWRLPKKQRINLQNSAVDSPNRC
jgi:hypothetical protein